MFESFREQISRIDSADLGDSVSRSFRWLLGGAAGGLVTHWVINGYGDLSLFFGASGLFLVAVAGDLFLKVILPDEVMQE